MEDIWVTKQIIRLRQNLLPKTSYLTGGTAASTLLVHHETINTGIQVREKIDKGLLESKEYDTVVEVENIADLTDSVQNHVIVFYSASLPSYEQSPTQNTAEQEAIRLLKDRKTKLAFSISDISSEDLKQQLERWKVHHPDQIQFYNPIEKSRIYFDRSVYEWNHQEEIYRVSKYYESSQIFLTTWYAHKIYNLSSKQRTTQLTKGFNMQPSVSSRHQFRYLWNMMPQHAQSFIQPEDLSHIEENKLRVLQRLADRPLFDPNQRSKTKLEEIKYPTEKWDKIVKDALAEGKDDWDIYSLIRKLVLGSTLEEDTDPRSLIVIQNNNILEDKASVVAATDERADHLVDLIYNSLPQGLANRGNIQSYLDYGCAEGGITAQLGKRLGLNKKAIFGADTRSITSLGEEFQFLQLPSEEKSKPTELTQILPKVSNNSISLITASMVFHHVIHVDHVILELRRVIDQQNGFLLIREHDCTSPASGVFLDIVHGLYSLAWQSPVEWPDFIFEYEAYYRGREQWNDLLHKNGFELVPAQADSYNAAFFSNYNNKKKRFPNVIRAYYACYQSRRDRNFDFSEFLTKPHLVPSSNRMILPSSASVSSIRTAGVKRKAAEVAFDSNESKEDERKVTAAVSAPNIKKMKNDDIYRVPCSMDDYVVRESKKYPGHYYKFFIYRNTCEWIVPIDVPDASKLQ